MKEANIDEPFCSKENADATDIKLSTEVVSCHTRLQNRARIYQVAAILMHFQPDDIFRVKIISGINSYYLDKSVGENELRNAFFKFYDFKHSSVAHDIHYVRLANILFDKNFIPAGIDLAQQEEFKNRILLLQKSIFINKKSYQIVLLDNSSDWQSIVGILTIKDPQQELLKIKNKLFELADSIELEVQKALYKEAKSMKLTATNNNLLFAMLLNNESQNDNQLIEETTTNLTLAESLVICYISSLLITVESDNASFFREVLPFACCSSELVSKKLLEVGLHILEKMNNKQNVYYWIAEVLRIQSAAGVNVSKKILVRIFHEVIRQIPKNDKIYNVDELINYATKKTTLLAQFELLQVLLETVLVNNYDKLHDALNVEFEARFHFLDNLVKEVEKENTILTFRSEILEELEQVFDKKSKTIEQLKQFISPALRLGVGCASLVSFTIPFANSYIAADAYKSAFLALLDISQTLSRNKLSSIGQSPITFEGWYSQYTATRCLLDKAKYFNDPWIWKLVAHRMMPQDEIHEYTLKVMVLIIDLVVRLLTELPDLAEIFWPVLQSFSARSKGNRDVIAKLYALESSLKQQAAKIAMKFAGEYKLQAECLSHINNFTNNLWLCLKDQKTIKPKRIEKYQWYELLDTYSKDCADYLLSLFTHRCWYERCTNLTTSPNRKLQIYGNEIESKFELLKNLHQKNNILIYTKAKRSILPAGFIAADVVMNHAKNTLDCQTALSYFLGSLKSSVLLIEGQARAGKETLAQSLVSFCVDKKFIPVIIKLSKSSEINHNLLVNRLEKDHGLQNCDSYLIQKSMFRRRKQQKFLRSYIPFLFIIQPIGWHVSSPNKLKNLYANLGLEKWVRSKFVFICSSDYLMQLQNCTAVKSKMAEHAWQEYFVGEPRPNYELTQWRVGYYKIPLARDEKSLSFLRQSCIKSQWDKKVEDYFLLRIIDIPQKYQKVYYSSIFNLLDALWVTKKTKPYLDEPKEVITWGDMQCLVSCIIDHCIESKPVDKFDFNEIAARFKDKRSNEILMRKQRLQMFATDSSSIISKSEDSSDDMSVAKAKKDSSRLVTISQSKTDKQRTEFTTNIYRLYNSMLEKSHAADSEEEFDKIIQQYKKLINENLSNWITKVKVDKGFIKESLLENRVTKVINEGKDDEENSSHNGASYTPS